MVIFVQNILDGCDTNEQGAILYARILANLKTDIKTTIDFSDVPNVTSSFVNSAFVDLLSDFDFDKIRRQINLSGANRQIANMVRDRMIKEAAKLSEMA